MNCLNFYKRFIKKIYLSSSLEGHPDVDHALRLLDGIPLAVVGGRDDIPERDRSSHTLFINRPASSIVGRCPGSRGHLCCNYLTVDVYEGCPIGCTYCIMKSYLNFQPLTVNIQTDEAIARIVEISEKNPGKTVRIGTGEVGDSLFFDPLFRLSERFVKALARLPNVYFELKTKTDFVDHLLDIPEKGNAVVAFSLNPDSISKTEEGIAAALADRIGAAAKAAEYGFNLAFHFDPVFYYQGWEDDYRGVIRMLDGFPPQKIVWISIGTFRYTRGLRDAMDERWFLYDEFVPCNDKKFRYIQRKRGAMYASLVRFLDSVLPGVPLYMCMESGVMWRKIFGQNPRKIDRLCAIFKKVALP
ncbi:MAG: radical SAM protein [Spirochaetales bacterium]|nr:radical SAM protein [Spirochaetales bacterium]